MFQVLITAILASHILAAWPAIRKFRHGVLPSTVDFGLLSFLLYYDVGLTADLFGIDYQLRPFPPLSEVDFNVWGIVAVLLFIAPWLLRLGERFTGANAAVELPRCTLKPRLKGMFYAASVLICAGCVFAGASFYRDAATIWSARLLIAETFGPLIIVLYLPLHLLAFYCRQTDSHSRKGLVFGIVLAITTVLATLAIGQRTTLLLPFLVLLVFRRRPVLRQTAIGAVVLFWIATLLLPSFKSFDVYGGKSFGELAMIGVAGDLVRGPVLAEVVQRSELLGTSVMPFPMAGYWYAVQFFVPRSIALDKGQSTAAWFTGNIVGRAPDELTWGFGIGFIEEIAVNIGLLGVPFAVVVYGFLLAKLDRLSARFPGVVPATRLAALWMCGYHLPALLMSFGVMGAVGLVCTALFSYTERQIAFRASRTPHILLERA